MGQKGQEARPLVPVRAGVIDLNELRRVCLEV